MHCPKCGVEVVEQAGFCHKCGARIDLADQRISPGEQAEPLPPQPVPAAEAPVDQPVEQPPSTAAEEFKQGKTGSQSRELEPEEELWQGGYSSKAMIGAWILSGLITIALLVIGAMYVRNTYVWLILVAAIVLLWLYQALKLCYRRLNIRYHLTDQRFIHETGILRRVTDRIEVIDMDDINFEQSFVERFVGVGTICISSSDRTHPDLVMPGIENGKKVAGMIDDVRRAERRRRGLHIESI